MANIDQFAALVDAGVVEWIDDMPVVVKTFSPFDMTPTEARANTLYQARRIVDTAPITAKDVAELMQPNNARGSRVA